MIFKKIIFLWSISKNVRTFLLFLKNYYALAFAMRIGFLKKKMIASQKQSRYDIFFGEKNLTLWLRFQDFPMFDEVFFYQNYQVPQNWFSENAVFIDLGAHIGLVSTYFFAKYSQITQFCIVEPSPKNIVVLEKNLFNITKAKTFIPKAIANDYSKFVIFNQSDISYNHKITHEEGEKIAATSVNEIFKTLGIKHCDVLKMDIEGAEKMVFEDNDLDWLRKTAKVLIELHDDFNLERLNEIVKKENFNAYSPTLSLKMNFLSKTSNEQ
jgi:FkbM family methyltransferase